MKFDVKIIHAHFLLNKIDLIFYKGHKTGF